MGVAVAVGVAVGVDVAVGGGNGIAVAVGTGVAVNVATSVCVGRKVNVGAGEVSDIVHAAKMNAHAINSSKCVILITVYPHIQPYVPKSSMARQNRNL